MLTTRFIPGVIVGTSVFLPAVSALIAGTLVQTAAPLYKQHYHGMLLGKPLPALTEAVLSATETVSPLWLGVLIGVATAFSAIYLIKTSADELSALRALLCCTTLAWVLIGLFFATTFLAFLLPVITLCGPMQGG